MKEAVAVYVSTTMFYVAAMVLFGPLVASVLGGIVVLVILAFLYAAGSDTPV
jgi:L-lactate permease